MHHILLNASARILKYVLESIHDWSDIEEETLVSKFHSHRLIHLAAMPLLYEAYHDKAKRVLELMVDHKELMQDKVINKGNRLGNTALHMVTHYSNDRALIEKVLTVSNIDPKQVNNDRLSPVHLAIDRDHHQSMLALLIYYMKPEEERDTDGMSMLERAVDKHSWACFYHLLQQAGTDWIDV